MEIGLLHFQSRVALKFAVCIKCVNSHENSHIVFFICCTFKFFKFSIQNLNQRNFRFITAEQIFVPTVRWQPYLRTLS